MYIYCVLGLGELSLLYFANYGIDIRRISRFYIRPALMQIYFEITCYLYLGYLVKNEAKKL